MTRLAFLPVAAMLFGAATEGRPATLFVTAPSSEICLTSQDADFQYRWGQLDPKSGLFSYYQPGETPLSPIVQSAEVAAPGDLMKIEVIESEDVDSVTAQIIGANRRVVSRGIGFRPLESTDRSRWVVLLGVPNMTEKGAYTLSLAVAAGDRTALQLSPIAVQERAFRFERIALTAGLTQLRVSEDARKFAEYKEMVRVLTTPHPDALFDEGPFRNPFPQARRTSGYGDRRKYLYSNSTSDFSVHEGLDLAMPEGTPVPACARGRVVLAGQRELTGGTVVIEHLPGLFSLYYHLSQILVKAGDVVAQGDVIGKVGQTGLATGPHLHWEIDDLGIPVDPDRLTAGPILDKGVESGEIESGKESKGGE